MTLHTSIQAELRAPLAEIQKGQNHSFTLPHSHLCIPRVYVLYSTAGDSQTHTQSTHTHTLPGTRLLPPGRTVWLHRLPRPVEHGEDGYCPDAVIISLMLAQMSMGSGDKGFLIPHMNLAPKGRRRRDGVCGG